MKTEKEQRLADGILAATAIEAQKIIVPRLAAVLKESEVYREAAKIYREASQQGHSAHWDNTRRHGAGCPECARARKLREKADALIKSANGGD